MENPSAGPRPLTPFEAAIEHGLPILGNVIAGAFGGAVLGFVAGLIPGLATNDNVAFQIIGWFAVAGAGFGLAKWNYTRRRAQ